MINRLSIIIWTTLAVVLVGCNPVDSADPLFSTQEEVAEKELQAASVTPAPIPKDVVKLELAVETAAPNPSELPVDEPVISNPTLQNLIDQAKADLAERLSILIEEIDLVEARAVVWPDASLGCPQPGMKYKQVPEDGALIILKVGETIYEYHNGGNRGLFLCEMLYKDPNPPPKLDIFNLTPSSDDKDNSSPTMPDNSIPPGEDQ